MKIKCLLLFVAAIVLAAPAFAVDETYYGTKLLITTKYDVDDFSFKGDYNDIAYWDEYMYFYMSRNGKENPAWSPDGSTIAFNGCAGYGLFTVPSTGGAAALVYNNWHKQEGYVYEGVNFGMAMMQIVAYTPDGKYLTFMDSLLDPARGSAITDNGLTRTVWHPIPALYNLDLATGLATKLVEEAVDGCWSPDGRYFVYSYQGTTLTEPTPSPFTSTSQCTWGVNLLDTQTGEKKTLVMWAYSPTFTPDGNYIIYSSQSSNTTGEFVSYGLDGNLYRIPVTGGTPEQITFCSPSTECRYPTDPMVSPNGEWLLFTGGFQEATGWTQGLCVMNMKTGGYFKAFPRADMCNLKAKWSPDGKKFVYTAKASRYSNNSRVYIADFQPTPFWKPTAVADATPAPFAIKGNHPNPFNPSTTIEFTLPVSGAASLSIYNIAGQKVRELTGGHLAAGAHSLVWDGRDSSGNLVSSGVYLSRLVMGAKTVTHRMLLAK